MRRYKQPDADKSITPKSIGRTINRAGWTELSADEQTAFFESPERTLQYVRPSLAKVLARTFDVPLPDEFAPVGQTGWREKRAES